MTKGANTSEGRKRSSAHKRRELGLDSRQTEYLRGIKPKWKLKVERHFRTGSAASQAISLKCCDCVGWEEPVARVRDCDITICALWRLRPFQGKAPKEGVE